MMKPFNVLDRNQNIHSDYLLEASAGTGKTFSIENLVIRLLLEGKDPLLLEKILVVTFTREAAFDLKVRIRSNIEKALDCLNRSEGPDYLMAFIENDEEKLAETRLRQALFNFDQAQIFTIHSFCSKILRENVFESDIGIESINGDRQIEETQILTIIRDFFRTSLDADFVSPAQLEIVLKKHRGDMENLEKTFLRYVSGGTEISSTRKFSQLFESFKIAMNALNLQENYIIEDFDLLENSYKKMSNSREKVNRFAALFKQDEWKNEDFDTLIKDGLHLVELFKPENLKIKAKLPSNEQLHYPLIREMLKNSLFPIVEEARSYPMIFARMASACQNIVWKYLEEEEKFRFDDLLKMVLNATEKESFKDQVQKRYRTAIIDEFQDTDPIQWEIFRRLFHKKSNLYLVGDPKQSIYAFRQADIYTYLNAAKILGDEHHASLDTNFRSQPSLIRALNTLFDQNVTPDWITLPRIHSSLVYPQVKASENVPESNFPDALHFFIAEDLEEKSKQEMLESAYFFPFIRQEISHLKIDFSKIAVLVKDHRQAKRLADYLEEHSISCSLQRSESLMVSSAYKAWKELLQAVLFPRDESAVKKALGGDIFAWNHSDVRTLDDILILEGVIAKFYRLRRILFMEGFASFFEKLLQSKWKIFSVAEEILKRKDGGEFFNDLQQIAELLIEEENRIQASPETVLRYLDTFLTMEANQDDRLKKCYDRNQKAVRILTIHSSKGLEFDAVFALGLINRTPRDELLFSCDQKLVPVFDVEALDYLNYLKELDAEKMRQLYVAMTRAKHRLYVPIHFAPSRKAAELGTASPMELFLARISGGELASNKTSLLHFISTHKEMGYSLLNTMEFSFASISQEEKITLKAPPEYHINHKPQYLLSYTSLAKSLSTENYSELRPPHDFDNSSKNAHTLPSGSLTGILIHEIFEKLPFDQIKNPDSIKICVKNCVSGTLFEEWEQTICRMIDHTLRTPLNGFCLADVDPRKIYRETEFLYPYDKGFLKGVIDFAFEHEGKYYLIDWKTNWLGPHGEDYQTSKLEESMKKHHYILQARIYQEALKKYLNIVESRSFEECFGGVFYLFVRGIDPTHEGQGVYYGIG